MRKGTVTAAELAERFEVSVRTIYRDMDTLSAAGIPIYAKKGKNGGICLIEQFVLDKMLLMGETRTEVKVISANSDAIRDAILTQIDRGVTILNGESGYLHNPSPVILSIISNRELPKVEKIIHNIDPESFIVVSRVSEVRGRGFSLNKRYQ